MPRTIPEILNGREAAERLRISQATLKSLREREIHPIPTIKIGRRWFYLLDEVLAWARAEAERERERLPRL
jgi:hypothetical protein